MATPSAPAPELAGYRFLTRQFIGAISAPIAVAAGSGATIALPPVLGESPTLIIPLAVGQAIRIRRAWTMVLAAAAGDAGSIGVTLLGMLIENMAGGLLDAFSTPPIADQLSAVAGSPAGARALTGFGPVAAIENLWFEYTDSPVIVPQLNIEGQALLTNSDPVNPHNALVQSLVSYEVWQPRK